MKITVMYLIISLWAIVYCSCNNGERKTNPELNNSDILYKETDVDGEAAIFMKNAARSGIMEVELGKLAQEKAQNERTKAFAKMMVTDHNRINTELEKLALEKKILLFTMPRPPLVKHYEQHVEEMQKLSGVEFDHHYIKMMAEEHQHDIEAFEKASRNRNPDVKKFASQKLPLLKAHLDSAKAIYASVNKKNQ